MEAFCHAAPSCGLSTTRNAGNGSAQLLTDDDLRTEREPVKEPAKRWRNWWRKTALPHVTHGGIYRRIGEVFAADRVWPSKDAAETAAAECALAFSRSPTGEPSARYIGAYPEGERP